MHSYLVFCKLLHACQLACLGEQMRLDVPIPEDLAPEGWADCFGSVSETANLCCHAGFNILEAGHAPDAWNWWKEFTEHDPHCKADPQGEARIIRQDGVLAVVWICDRTKACQDAELMGKNPSTG